RRGSRPGRVQVDRVHYQFGARTARRNAGIVIGLREGEQNARVARVPKFERPAAGPAAIRRERPATDFRGARGDAPLELVTRIERRSAGKAHRTGQVASSDLAVETRAATPLGTAKADEAVEHGAVFAVEQSLAHLRSAHLRDAQLRFTGEVRPDHA